MEPPFKPEEILRILEKHGVDFIVVGGFAAIMHGSPENTNDIDIAPEQSRENLERLSAALDELNARIRTEAVEGGMPFAHSGESLAGVTVLNMVTDLGALDVTSMPAGTHGYRDLTRDATTMIIGGTRADIASLADVIRSKEAANRDKDRASLPTLRKILEEKPDES